MGNAEAADIPRGVMPAWALDLPTNVHTVMMTVLRKGLLPNLDRATVKAAGELFWLEQPALGRIGVARLGRAVGGWPGLPAEEFRRLEGHLVSLRRWLERLEAEFAALQQQAHQRR